MTEKMLKLPQIIDNLSSIAYYISIDIILIYIISNVS